MRQGKLAGTIELVEERSEQGTAPAWQPGLREK